ncbi:methyltransferase [Microlunatus panaciterrae]|uniref:16S rRNA G1207 methylase RsmC n=1 Tax=Microlunatus panaciterrae TaxID=400768 RepID=A0ABS2RKS0_9ACTN|nr:methyltransferase [Microlunatus panaciterrae]MBM7799603.1 16S rRNA G1207 methylase RsmC [Microlunatus panaciterrae]
MIDHYFQTPDDVERRRAVTARIWGTEYELTTANAVFSFEGLDLGTAVLMRESPIPENARRLLDLGCGYGPIALALADHCPSAVVDAVDVNDRALALCRDNAAALRLSERVRVLRPEQVPPDASYDEIWSNPPIRIGKQALHELLLTWLPRLAPEGVARLVVGRNLGADSLQRWLGEQGWSCERVASAKGFRVFEVRRADNVNGSH